MKRRYKIRLLSAEINIEPAYGIRQYRRLRLRMLRGEIVRPPAKPELCQSVLIRRKQYSAERRAIFQ